MKQFIYVFVVFVVFEIGSITKAYAEPIDLSLYPPQTEIIATAGSSIKAPLRVSNNGPKRQHLTFAFMALGQENIPPGLLFSLEKDGKPQAGELTLRPEETADLSLLIVTTTNNADKDYYITFLFQTKNDAKLKQTGSKIEAGIGSNILLSLYKEAADIGKITVARVREFSTQKTFFLGKPVSFALLVESQGPHFIKTSGEIKITDINGYEIAKFMLPKQTILAYSSYDMASGLPSLSSTNLFGKYKAQATIAIDQGEVLVESTTFYAVPKKASIIALITLSFLFIVLVRLASFRKKHFVPSQQTKKRRKKV